LIAASVTGLILLRNINFGVTLEGNLLDCFCSFADNEAYHLIWDVKLEDFVFV
jgi:hypothetical protein